MSWPHKGAQNTLSGAAELKNVYPKNNKIESQSSNTTAMLSAIRTKLNEKRGLK